MNNSDKVVLVVEDNAANMKFFHALLDAHGYIVLQATDGMEGWRMAREHRPALILMDIQLPDISGLEVCTPVLPSPIKTPGTSTQLNARSWI